MSMVLNEEQFLLKNKRGGLQKYFPVSSLRDLRDSGRFGLFRGAWGAIGRSGVYCPSSYRSRWRAGFGFIGLGALMQEMGRRCSVAAFSTIVLGTSALELGTGKRLQRYLPDIPPAN